LVQLFAPYPPECDHRTSLVCTIPFANKTDHDLLTVVALVRDSSMTVGTTSSRDRIFRISYTSDKIRWYFGSTPSNRSSRAWSCWIADTSSAKNHLVVSPQMLCLFFRKGSVAVVAVSMVLELGARQMVHVSKYPTGGCTAYDPFRLLLQFIRIYTIQQFKRTKGSTI
jgi:hypothetical protein